MRIPGWLLAGVVGGGLALAPAAAARADRLVLDWWHALSGELGAALEKVAERFNASQDRYELKPVNKGNYVATLNAAIAAWRAKEHPLLLMNNESGVLTMMLSGAIVPVHDVLDKYKVEVKLEQYLRPVVQTYTDRNGRLLAMPFNSSTPILFYNKDILDAAGIAAPPKTWQEMEEQIRTIRAKGAADCGYSFAAGPWQELENYSVWHDIPVATKRNGFDGLDAVLVYNKTRFVQHVERLKRWVDEGLATFGAAAAHTWASAARSNFIEGRCAFWIDSTAWHSTVEAGAKMKWGASFLPHEADLKPNHSMIGGAALYLFKGFSDAHYEGAATFFRFLTDPEVQLDWHKATGYVPITVAAWELAKKQGYYETHPTRGIAVEQLLMGEERENSRTIRLGNYENVRKALTDQLELVWAGKKGVKEALDQAVEDGNAILRRFEQQNKGKI
jgi:sn-glycerol 3-phosphate transport system substrate-binding protein